MFPRRRSIPAEVRALGRWAVCGVTRRSAFHQTGRFTWKSRESISTVTASMNSVLAPLSSGSGRSRSVIYGTFFISERFRRAGTGFARVLFLAIERVWFVFRW